jgi:hypothetical protein
MIPFFALLALDHELPSIWLPTNTIKLIYISPLIFDAPSPWYNLGKAQEW